MRGWIHHSYDHYKSQYDLKIGFRETLREHSRGLSIITAAHPNKLDHLHEAAASIDEIRQSAEFPVEWLVCLDGPLTQDFKPFTPMPDILLSLPVPRGVYLSPAIGVWPMRPAI